MYAYADYANELTALATELSNTPQHAGLHEERARALASGPMVELRRSRKIDDLRQGGTFFTGPALAEELWSNALHELGPTSLVVDPAVGVGDLLLPAARALFDRGVRDWPLRLAGVDIDESFVGVAKTRLRLATDTALPEDGFRNLRTHDFFAGPIREMATATHVVMNPPFVRMSVNDDPHWHSTSVNAAALFVERTLSQIKTGTRLLAVLPEVLRSGSRYESWRKRVAGFSSRTSVKALGQFDSKTDVHVFILDLVASESETKVEWPDRAHERRGSPNVGDHFSVRVGSVVPHRHPNVGTLVAFAQVRDISPWTEFDQFTTMRGFGGRLDRGPFVLVRRTSRPGDKFRAQASLYTGSDDIAVENHLIVLRPKRGGVAACRALMRILADDRTTAYLDKVIRLRHLTVGSVESIPWGAHDHKRE